jgi:hypothetical protein
MALYKIGAARKPTAELDTFVGEVGDLFYSEEDPRLRISDGSTPGGILVTTNALSGESEAISNIDLSAVTQSIVPAEADVYDLGAPGYEWRDLHLSGNTLYIGGVAIYRDADTNTIVLPQGTKIAPAQEGQQPIDIATTAITADDLQLQLYLEDLLNIDVTNRQEGSLLQYRNNTWTAVNDISTANVEILLNGGTY